MPTGDAGIGLAKRLKQLRLLFFRDANTAVLHAQRQLNFFMILRAFIDA